MDVCLHVRWRLSLPVTSPQHEVQQNFDSHHINQTILPVEFTMPDLKLCNSIFLLYSRLCFKGIVDSGGDGKHFKITFCSVIAGDEINSSSSAESFSSRMDWTSSKSCEFFRALSPVVCIPITTHFPIHCNYLIKSLAATAFQYSPSPIAFLANFTAVGTFSDMHKFRKNLWCAPQKYLRTTVLGDLPKFKKIMLIKL